MGAPARNATPAGDHEAIGLPKHKVLLGGMFPEIFRSTLAERFNVVGPLDGQFEEFVDALSVAEAKEIRAIVTMASATINSRIINALPALGIICCRGSGYDGVDMAAARARGIAVTNAPGLSSSSVADMAMGLLIACARNMVAGRQVIEQGLWRDDTIHSALRVRGLTGCRLGVFGLGAIGSKIAQRAEAFEMKIGYHNRQPHPVTRHRYFATLQDLADWADVLMVSVRASAENRHSINSQVLGALGKGGFVINVSRGSVVDEGALVQALSSGVIAGAGLDVFEHEPAVPPSLLAMPNVALTPHMGADTETVQTQGLRLVIDNLDSFFANRPLLTPVSI